MKNNLRKAFFNAFSVALAMAAPAVWGQVSLPATSPYTENFNTTPGASGTAYPTGWVAYNNTTADASMTVGTNASTAGANYNYGSRIGILGSGSAFVPSSIVLAISNTTGKTGLSISYDVIKIREQARSNSFNLEISTTSATSGFTAIPAGAYASASLAEGTVSSFTNIDLSALDNISGTVFIRWSYTEISGSGSRDGIALDNVSLSWGTAPSLATPVATAATAINHNNFQANWDAAAGATGYRLDVSTSSTFGTFTAATDLFFSEYVEGSSSNKYLEIYNGTGATVNLADYRVRLYANGATTATTDTQLSGSLANGATAVVKNNLATIYTGTAAVVAAVNFNGDDAVALYKISTAANVDIFGAIGEDPGAAWTGTTNTTVDKTLVRKASVSGGVTVSAAGFPTLDTEWDMYNQDDVTHLGSHTYGGLTPIYVAGYEDLAVSGTSVVVTGLTGSTNYYYRVRATDGTTTTANSNVISLTTAVNTDPTLTISAPLAGFGDQCIDTLSGVLSFSVSGINLTTANVEIGPLTGYTFSESATGPFTASLTLTQGGGTYTHDIYVRFEPTTVASYDGNISISGGGATAVNAAATAEGVSTVATVAITAATGLTTSTAEVQADITEEGCTTVSERGIVYGTSPAPEFGQPGVQFIDAGTAGTGAYIVSIDSLLGGTTYYVRAYAINDGGIAYSADSSFTTEGVAAPLAVSATAVGTTSFTANWEPVEGAESYRLDVSEEPTFGTLSQATDLFFSEYVEGSSSNKYIEIYNGTGNDVDLSDYRIRLYANGTTTPTNDVQLRGILENDNVIVLRNNLATVYTGTTTVNAAINFNGNDAVALFKISAADNVDIIGNIGENPGTAWAGASNSTLNKTLVRKPEVSGGVTVNPVSGFPTLETEWDVLDQDDVTNLGAHTYAGQTPSFVAGYENLTVNDTLQAVSGLAAGTTYYYRVRAVAGNTSANSNTISVTTTGTAKMVKGGKDKGADVANANGLMVYKQNNVLTVNSSNSNIKSVTVFDITGKLVFNGDFDQKSVAIDNITAANQILIVKAITADNQLQVKKVIF
ncbi:beta strand repeat-containing protein [Flavobacterium sp. RHBU_3]|uniref:beta strand repeat-containing protein n=1 Tax=Flavobacterium sp. RHBU_3 TaxID=3391184 RepID=UPI003984ABF0